MKGSLRRRAVAAIFLAAVSFFVFAGLTTTIDARFVWPAVFFPMSCGAYLLTLRCPRCGALIYRRKATLFGHPIT